MKSLNYSLNEQIGGRELAFALPGFIVGLAVLSLPHQLAKVTEAVDGWVSILAAGILISFISLLALKLALKFPGQTFYSYSSYLVSKPIAMILNFIYTILLILVTAYVVRGIADIAKYYLFDKTPIEFIALSFLLVVIYAVSGSRPGLFRINIMFFPIIVSILLLIIILNIRWFELDNLFPLFKSDIDGYLKGMKATVGSYVGFGVVLFYTSIVKDTKNLTRKVVVGLSFPLVIYLVIFLTTIGVFGNAVTSNLIYPTIELAKRVEFPGGIIERIESVFFVVWMMAIFSTAAFSFDLAVFTIQSVWKKVAKIRIILMLSPLIFWLSMLPENDRQVELVGTFTTNFLIPYTIAVIITLLCIAKLRGVKRDG